MASQKIKDLKREFQRGFTLMLMGGPAVIVWGLILLLLSPILRVLGVLQILMGIFYVSWGTFLRRSAWTLAQRRAVRGAEEKPHWLAKKRNFILFILIGEIPFLILSILIVSYLVA